MLTGSKLTPAKAKRSPQTPGGALDNHAKTTTLDKLSIKFIANKWVSDHLDSERRHISLNVLEYDRGARLWAVDLVAKRFDGVLVGRIHIDTKKRVVKHTKPTTMSNHIRRLNASITKQHPLAKNTGEYGLFYGDGIRACRKLSDASVDLLLTDPPYGISNPYTCEEQIPRRMRKNGADFIMPKGEFGEWDHGFRPKDWTCVVLPKIKGWAVIFCAQAQIKEYSDILLSHKFNSVGTLVWHKTNPVPFNHKFKPVNAWEAAVIGKRPGTKFNGKTVHNVFTFKSPSPQHRIHPTQKPLDLFKTLIKLFSNKHDAVLDPFAGSATTVLAATQLGRRPMAFENNLEYFKLAQNRLSLARATLN